jgi:hypothetical protein
MHQPALLAPPAKLVVVDVLVDDEGPNHSYDVFPANHRFLEWRDPDSNRGLHDLSGPSWVVTPTAVRRRRPYLSHFADLEALRGPPAIGAGRRGVTVGSAST